MAATNKLLFEVTNRADWVQQIQVNDSESPYDLLDLTGAAISVRMIDSEGCEKFSLTAGDGIEIVSTGIIEFTVDDAVMGNICPGTYDIGGIYRLNDETNDLFVGTVTVVNNPARL